MPFLQGLIAGYGIAIPVGAIAVLIVNAGVQKGFRAGFMAGAGAATADVVFAVLAAIAGQMLSGWLVPVALPLRVVSGLVLVALGGYGLWRARQASGKPGRAIVASESAHLYRQFLGLTLLNPMTVAYFGSLILGGSGADLASALDRALFVLGAGVASLSWQTLLAGLGAFAGQRLSPRLQLATNLLGNIIVAGLGAHLLFQLTLA